MPIKELKLEYVPRVKNIDVPAKREVLSRMFEGQWLTAYKGRGLEFAGFRKYQYGDDASLIDWKASLRSREILIREFEEYKTVNVYFLIDVSNSMLFSSTGKLKCEYAAELSLMLIHAILNSDDAVGLGMFTDKLVARHKPQVGRGVYYRLLKDITNPQLYGGGFNISKAVEQSMAFLKEKCLFIIISDFISMDKDWEYHLRYLAHKYDLIGIMIRDPRDRAFPDKQGEFILQDPYTNQGIVVDTSKFAKEFKEHVRKEEEGIRNFFKMMKAGFLQLSTDQEFYNPVLRFFHQRLASVH